MGPRITYQIKREGDPGRPKAVTIAAKSAIVTVSDLDLTRTADLYALEERFADATGVKSTRAAVATRPRLCDADNRAAAIASGGYRPGGARWSPRPDAELCRCIAASAAANRSLVDERGRAAALAPVRGRDGYSRAETACVPPTGAASPAGTVPAGSSSNRQMLC